MTRQTMLLGGLAGVLVIALWWLFLFSPGQERLAEIETEIEAAEAETISLQQRVAQLVSIRERAPETEAGIVKLRSIVPDDNSLPSALRQLEAAADDSGVAITLLNTTRPAPVDAEAAGGAGQLYSLNVSMSFSGSYFQVVDFLRRLEDPTVVSRGIVVSSIAVAPSELPVLDVTIQARMYAVLDPAPSLPGEEPAAPPAPEEDTDSEATEEDAA